MMIETFNETISHLNVEASREDRSFSFKFQTCHYSRLSVNSADQQLSTCVTTYDKLQHFAASRVEP